jgi:hypothetical protein
MSWYLVSLLRGRRLGDIGIFSRINVSVRAEDEDRAKAAVMARYESAGPGPVVMLDFICPDGPLCPEGTCKEARRTYALVPDVEEPIINTEVRA